MKNVFLIPPPSCLLHPTFLGSAERALSAKETTLKQLDTECKLRKAEAGLEQNPLRRQQLEKQIDEEFKARCVRELRLTSGPWTRVFWSVFYFLAGLLLIPIFSFSSAHLHCPPIRLLLKISTQTRRGRRSVRGQSAPD